MFSMVHTSFCIYFQPGDVGFPLASHPVGFREGFRQQANRHGPRVSFLEGSLQRLLEP